MLSSIELNDEARSGTREEEGKKKRVVDAAVAVELGTEDRGTEKDGLRKLSVVRSD